MTRNVKLIGILLVVLFISNGCHFAHRRISEKVERSQIRRENRFMGRNHIGPGGGYISQGPMAGKRGQMGPMRGFRGGNMQMNGGRRGMGMGPGNQMGWGRGQMAMNPFNGGPMGPGNLMGRIPNLTEKQRKDIADLRQKQMEAMDKIREETAAKMQSLREANRKKMLDLLTDEQKKFLESGPVRPVPAPVK